MAERQPGAAVLWNASRARRAARHEARGARGGGGDDGSRARACRARGARGAMACCLPLSRAGGAGAGGRRRATRAEGAWELEPVGARGRRGGCEARRVASGDDGGAACGAWEAKGGIGGVGVGVGVLEARRGAVRRRAVAMGNSRGASRGVAASGQAGRRAGGPARSRRVLAAWKAVSVNVLGPCGRLAGWSVWPSGRLAARTRRARSVCDGQPRRRRAVSGGGREKGPRGTGWARWMERGCGYERRGGRRAVEKMD